MEDATKALDATNGTTLEKNGQILRVAYAKSILGPGSGPSGSSQSSSLAAAAIEAATFAQQVLKLFYFLPSIHLQEQCTVIFSASFIPAFRCNFCCSEPYLSFF